MTRSVKMPSQSDMDKAYKGSIGKAGTKYKAKVLKTTGVIQAGIDAQPLYVAKMSDPSVLARRAENLAKVTDGDWQKAAAEKGAPRLGPGMTAGAAKRSANYEPIRTGLDGLPLADKTANWEENVDNNVKGVIRKQKELAGKL
ncbi:unnamed protein product [marine sediment metagenome]|uniref:Uncharacterized protein n=1 Tax=marine sediment metagenome TaxID=412755 RepID=X1D5K3_9ZZZZ